MQLCMRKFPKLCNKQEQRFCPSYSTSSSFDSGKCSPLQRLCNRFSCWCFFTGSWSAFILSWKKPLVRYEMPLHYLISWQMQPKAGDDIYTRFPAHDCQSKRAGASINRLKGVSSSFCCTWVVEYPRKQNNLFCILSFLLHAIKA